MPIIKIETMDRKILEVDDRILNISDTLQDAVEGVTKLDADGIAVIATNHIHSESWKQILDWINHHKYDPPYVRRWINGKISDELSEWDENFLLRIRHINYEVLMNANYLKIKALFDLANIGMDRQLGDKSPAEMSHIFSFRTHCKEENFTIEDGGDDDVANEKNQLKEEEELNKAKTDEKPKESEGAKKVEKAVKSEKVENIVKTAKNSGKSVKAAKSSKVDKEIKSKPPAAKLENKEKPKQKTKMAAKK